MMLIRVTTWNMRGAMYGTSYFENLLEESDVCIVTEHWLNRYNICFLHEIAKDFRVFSCTSSSTCNSSKGSGGVAILVRKTCGYKTNELNIENDRICAVKLVKRGYENVCIIGVLLPSTNYSVEEYLSYFSTVCSIYEQMSSDCVTIVCGDFNTDISLNVKNTKSKHLLNFVESNNMSPAPLITGCRGPKYTYRSKDGTRKTLIDYIMIPEFLCNGCSDLKVRNDCLYNVSDHYPISITLDTNLLCNTSNKLAVGRKVLLWSKSDEWQKQYYRSELDKLLDINLSNYTVNDEFIEQFNSILVNAVHSAAISCIPTGYFRHFLKPYWKSNQLNLYHDQQRHARNQWISEGRVHDKDNIYFIEYKTRKTEFRKRKRRAERRWREEKYADVSEAAELDISEFYRVVRKQRQNKSTTPSMSYNGVTAETDNDICKLWSNYFSDLYTPSNDATFDKSFYDTVSSKVKDYSELSPKTTQPILDEPYTIDEVTEQIQTLKCRKAPGPDYITNEHIIHGGKTIVKWMCYIFNMMHTSEYVPFLYRHGIIVPLYKGNNKDKTSPNSYRAITLTSVMGKVYEKVVLSRITKMLNNIGMTFPDPLQFGFVPEHGSIPALYTLNECINFFRNCKSKLFVCFLDNQKAFDKIWHDGLFLKLKDLGVTGKLWNILFMSYKQASAHVQYNGFISNNFAISQGVGQGRVISAWFFSLYINDLISELKAVNSGISISDLNIPAILLADDTTLLSTSAHGLQRLLDCVQNYACRWRLTYNGTKSCLMLFDGHKQNDSEISVRLGETFIENKNEHVYAGTLITRSVKTTERTKSASKKLKKNLHSLYNIGVNPKCMTPVTNAMIWKRMILPTGLYACEIWGGLSNTEIDLLERTQRYAARFIQCMDKTSPIDSTISNLGLWSIESVTDKFKLLFFGRLCRSNSSTTHKKLFHILISQIILEEDEIGNTITYDLIKTLVKYDMFSFLETFVHETFIPKKDLWSKIVRQSISISEENRWLENIENRPELLRYSKIHSTLTEHRLIRLTLVYPNIKRELLVLVKLGSMAIKKATCPLCCVNSSDILLHLIMSCHALLTERSKLHYTIVDVLPVQTSVDIFNLEESDILLVMLGSVDQDIIQELSPDLWSIMMFYIAKCMYPLYKKIQPVLIENKFNFDY